jgi:hypothetical protein
MALNETRSVGVTKISSGSRQDLWLLPVNTMDLRVP